MLGLIQSTDNSIIVTSSALPTGAATSAKQDTGNASLGNLDTNIGAKVDTTATNDSGTFSFISLFKRLLAQFQRLLDTTSTAAKQDTAQTSLSSIDAKLTAPIAVSGSFTATPSGTQDTNLKQVNGATVNVGTGTSSTGTQRVTVASDSTIGIVAGSAIIGKTGIDQTTPGTTNKVTVGSDVIHTIVDSGSNVIGGVKLIDTGGSNAASIDASGHVQVDVADPLPAGTNLIGKVGIDQTTPGTTNKVTVGSDVIHTIIDSGTVSTITNVVHVDDNSGSLTVDNGGTFAVQATLAAETTKVLGVVRTADGSGNLLTSTASALDINNKTFPTLTKGTQGSTGVSVQELSQAGRTVLRFYATAVASGTTTTETAITLTKSANVAATSTGTSFTVTNGKTFRIQSITFGARGHSTATIQSTIFSIRTTGGAVGTSSTPVILQVRCATPATASAWDRVTIPFEDGMDIVGDGTQQWGVTAAATFTTNAPTWDVYIVGYEY